MPQVDIKLTSTTGQYQNVLKLYGDGVSLPVLTTAGRLALSLGLPEAGLVVWDSNLQAIFQWNGTAWTALGTGGSYTQGTWLAQLISAVGTITEDPAVKTGYWSRIGNTVSVSLKIRVQSIAGGPSGLLKIITLPLPAVQETAITVHADLLNNGAKTSLAAYATGYDVNMYHYENGLLNPLSQHVPAGGIFWISGSYITP